MLGLQDDVDDIELKQRWRLYWIYSIFEFSNTQIQEASWREDATELHQKESIWSASFAEAISAYFDDLGLYAGYDKAHLDGNVTDQEAQNAASFHLLLAMYDEPSQSGADILDDEDWIEVTQEALKLWNYLKKSVTSQREIDLVDELEKNYKI